MNKAQRRTFRTIRTEVTRLGKIHSENLHTVNLTNMIKEIT